jgi:urease accessory protein
MRLSLAIAIPVVMVFALFHGHAHGSELTPGADAVLYSLGFVVATGLLHALGIGIGAVDRLPNGRSVVRALGGGVLLGGVYFLLGAIA